MSAVHKLNHGEAPNGSLASLTICERHIARRPPECRGLARDGVRLLVTDTSAAAPHHAHLYELPDFLRPGDLLVLNDSQTLPAALPATREDHLPALLHLSTRLDAEHWSVELRQPHHHGSRPSFDGRPGEVVGLPDGARARLEAPYRKSRRLWRARLEYPSPLHDFLERHGQPIRYDYVDRAWSIDHYRTPVGSVPGSAEMPSAGRGLTAGLLDRLAKAGVHLTTITLHTGVSSLESDEPPYPERFVVSKVAAATVNATRRRGGRVIAVGTTCVRALESAAVDGEVRGQRGWTDLVVTPERGVGVVDGLLTGLHEPRSTHLKMLSALVPRQRLARDYAEALSRDYLWHEFGDMQLIVGR